MILLWVAWARVSLQFHFPMVGHSDIAMLLFGLAVMEQSALASPYHDRTAKVRLPVAKGYQTKQQIYIYIYIYINKYIYIYMYWIDRRVDG